jgi:hypothetical protein
VNIVKTKIYKDKNVSFTALLNDSGMSIYDVRGIHTLEGMIKKYESAKKKNESPEVLK